MNEIYIIDNCSYLQLFIDPLTKWDTSPKWTNSPRQVALTLSSLGFICVALTAIRSLRKAFANAGSACSPGRKIVAHGHATGTDIYVLYIYITWIYMYIFTYKNTWQFQEPIGGIPSIYPIFQAYGSGNIPPNMV